jgi:hypothetical protein
MRGSLGICLLENREDARGRGAGGFVEEGYDVLRAMLQLLLLVQDKRTVEDMRTCEKRFLNMIATWETVR